MPRAREEFSLAAAKIAMFWFYRALSFLLQLPPYQHTAILSVLAHRRGSPLGRVTNEPRSIQGRQDQFYLPRSTNITEGSRGRRVLILLGDWSCGLLSWRELDSRNTIYLSSARHTVSSSIQLRVDRYWNIFENVHTF
jgi:hypothetical protein